MARTWGNLSVRLDEDAMLITPSGIAYPDLTESMIVRVDLANDAWSGPYRPSGERKLHAETYRRRPDVLAGVHTHQSAASICAAARVAVPTPFGMVPCAPYALPGTKRITKGTVDALGSGPAVLMANHGAFAVGGSLSEAFDRVIALERACADHVAQRRAAAGGDLPAAADARWDPSWLRSVRLADGTRAWLSTAPFTLRFSESRRPLPPVLDDLAQLTGRHVPTSRELPSTRPRSDAVLVAGQGALVLGDDYEAVAMVVEKAARAVIGGAALGAAHPLPLHEAMLMRVVYVRSYSKQAATDHPTADPAT